ncbi:MAG: diguanylate cyclase, partial [Microthrixaceae bacterium]|nr:diguanylate cyclase [Microthrixaceae bacterium]
MRNKSWLIALTGGLVLSGVAASQGEQSVGITTQLVGWASVFIGLRIAVGNRRDAGRPWALFALAASAFLLGGIVRMVHGTRLGIDRPFPSYADVVIVIGYVLLIAGAGLLGHLRAPDRDRTAIIDGAILAIGLQTVVWAWLTWPYLSDPSVPLDARLLNGCYGLLTTAVLATVARLALGPGARTGSYRLLAMAVLLIFTQDVLVTLETLGRITGEPGQSLSPMIFVVFGAAALHPERLSIAEAFTRLDTRLTWRRVAALATAMFVGPLTLGLQHAMGRTPAFEVAAVSTILLTLLVVARFALLAKTQERAVDVQRIQGEANAALATATNREAMFQAGLVAVHDIVGDSEARVSIATFTDGSLRVNWSRGAQSERAVATPVPLTRMPGRVVDSLDSLQSVVSDDGSAVDLKETDQLKAGRCTVLIAPLVCQGHLDAMLILTTPGPLPSELRRIVETTCSTVSLALESAALTENLLRQQTERRFRVLVENSSDVVLVITDDRRITFASSAAGHLLGYGDDDLIGSDPQRWVHSRDWPLLEPLLERAADGEPEGSRSHEAPPPVRLRRSDGTYGWYEVSTRDLRHDPEIQGIVATAREISDRKAAEDRLAASEARFRALVQHSSDVVAVIDDDLIFSYVSPAIEPLLGLDPDRLIGCSALEVLGAEGAVQFLQNSTVVHEGRLPELSVQSHRFEVDAVHRSGAQVTLEVALTDLRDDPAVGGVVLNARDVSMRKTLEADLRHQAFHDGLTGLANRTMFADRITAALDAADLDTTTIAALFIDIDDFKIVNDSLGHAVGDHLLSEVAHRLVGHLGTSGTAARLGGDEFAVLVVTDEGEAAVAEMAERILAVVAEPFTIEGREIRVTCSIGIALAMRDDAGTTTDTKVLLRSADVAMYLAKDRGRNRAAMFEEHLHTTVFERMELKADLERALNSDQLRCHYQPIVSLRSG